MEELHAEHHTAGRAEPLTKVFSPSVCLGDAKEVGGTPLSQHLGNGMEKSSTKINSVDRSGIFQYAAAMRVKEGKSKHKWITPLHGKESAFGAGGAGPAHLDQTSGDTYKSLGIGIPTSPIKLKNAATRGKGLFKSAIEVVKLMNVLGRDTKAGKIAKAHQQHSSQWEHFGGAGGHAGEGHEGDAGNAGGNGGGGGVGGETKESTAPTAWLRHLNKPIFRDPCQIILEGHLGGVHCVAFEPAGGGGRVASGGADGTVRLWGPNGDALQVRTHCVYYSTYFHSM